MVLFLDVFGYTVIGHEGLQDRRCMMLMPSFVMDIYAEEMLSRHRGSHSWAVILKWQEPTVRMSLLSTKRFAYSLRVEIIIASRIVYLI